MPRSPWRRLRDDVLREARAERDQALAVLRLSHESEVDHLVGLGREHGVLIYRNYETVDVTTLGEAKSRHALGRYEWAAKVMDPATVPALSALIAEWQNLADIYEAQNGGAATVASTVYRSCASSLRDAIHTPTDAEAAPSS